MLFGFSPVELCEGSVPFIGGFPGSSFGGFDALCLGILLEGTLDRFHRQRGGRGFFSFLFFGFAFISGGIKVIRIKIIIIVQRIFFFFRLHSSLNYFI